MTIKFTLLELVIISLAGYYTVSTAFGHPMPDNKSVLILLQIASIAAVFRCIVGAIKSTHPYEKKPLIKAIYYGSTIGYVIFFWWSVILALSHIL